MTIQIVAEPLHIAMDGPVASGKGTVSAILARRLGIIYIYTGGMYRSLALSCLRGNIDIENETEVLAQLQKITIELAPSVSTDTVACRVLLNGEDVTQEIKKPEVAKATPVISKIKKVREHMVSLQQEIAKDKSVIMEGRDISVRVLPNAQLKLYLDASVNERARRLQLLWQKQAIVVSMEKALEATNERDLHDQSRTVDPLQKAADAQVVQTENQAPDQVVDTIIKMLAQKNLITIHE